MGGRGDGGDGHGAAVGAGGDGAGLLRGAARTAGPGCCPTAGAGRPSPGARGWACRRGPAAGPSGVEAGGVRGAPWLAGVGTPLLVSR